MTEYTTHFHNCGVEPLCIARYFDTGSSSRSLPFTASRAMSAAVDCFDTDMIMNGASGVWVTFAAAGQARGLWHKGNISAARTPS